MSWRGPRDTCSSSSPARFCSSRPRQTAAMESREARHLLRTRLSANHGENGLIAFTRYRRQDDPIWSEIFVANPDGSGVRRVSRSPEAVEDDQAHWSPDGAWIVFARCRPAPEVCSIWLVRPDGSGQREISRPCPPHATPPACADDSNPSFAPDSRHIVFQHEHGHVRSDSLGDQIERSDIVETDLAGAHRTVLVRLTGYRGDVMGPRLSPDGRHLVFERYDSSRARPKGGQALFIASATGGDPRRLTPWPLRAAGADWSPDGTRILFRSWRRTRGREQPVQHPSGRTGTEAGDARAAGQLRDQWCLLARRNLDRVRNGFQGHTQWARRHGSGCLRHAARHGRADARDSCAEPGRMALLGRRAHRVANHLAPEARSAVRSSSRPIHRSVRR